MTTTIFLPISSQFSLFTEVCTTSVFTYCLLNPLVPQTVTAHFLEGKVVWGFWCQVLSFHLLGGLEKFTTLLHHEGRENLTWALAKKSFDPLAAQKKKILKRNWGGMRGLGCLIVPHSSSVQSLLFILHIPPYS